MSPRSSSLFDSNTPKSCSSCCYPFEDDTATSTYWDLDCGHRLCAGCFTSFSLSTTVVTRCCPSCKQSPFSLVHTSFKFRGRGRNKKLHKVEEEISLLHPDGEDDFLHFTQGIVFPSQSASNHHHLKIHLMLKRSLKLFFES